MALDLAEFQQLFRDIRTAIVDLIKATVDPATTKVIGRDVFDDTAGTWLGRLSAPDDSIHCWSVFYKGCPDLDAGSTQPLATDIYVPEFRIVGYMGYNFGTDLDNSTDKFTDELSALRWAFRQSRTLGLGSPVNEHTGFKDRTLLGKIDTQRVHIARVDLGVILTPLAYDYA